MLNVDRVRRDLRQPGTAPLHVRLRAAIREQVLDGTLQPGQALAAERNLQEQLGVSRSTVRQAIKSLVDDGLLESLVGAGTFVVEPRRPARERDLVGVVVPDADFYLYYADLAASLGFRLREAGLRIDMSLHDERVETLLAVTRGLLEQNLAAMVMVPPAGLDIDVIIRELRARGVVVVLLARYLDTRLDLDLDYVSVDNQRIGYEATRHLLELGHTGIIHLPGTRTTTVRDRAVGYIRAMREVSLEPRMLVPPTEPGAPPADLEAYLVDPDAALMWAQVGRRDVTAAFCFNDAIATWVQKEVRNLNLSIPRDLSMIAVDDMPYADFFDAPLTTFALPGEEIAAAAASLVLRRLNGEALAAQHMLIPARLMVRRSTAPPRTALGQLAASVTRSK